MVTLCVVHCTSGYHTLTGLPIFIAQDRHRLCAENRLVLRLLFSVVPGNEEVAVSDTRTTYVGGVQHSLMLRCRSL